MIRPFRLHTARHATPARLGAALGALAAALLAVPACAGPPYLTDDPEPTDPGHWEIYNFVQGDSEPGFREADAGFDINYGGAKDLQLTATLPVHIETGAPLAVGDIQLAAKYRFLHQKDAFFDVSLFPRFFVPTGRGSTYTQFLLPAWVEHDWGKWSLFGGGGYTWQLTRRGGEPVTPDTPKGYWQNGAVLTRQIRPGFSLGLEYFGQGGEVHGQGWQHFLDLGTQIHIKGPFSLLGQWGRGVNVRETVFYTSLKLDL